MVVHSTRSAPAPSIRDVAGGDDALRRGDRGAAVERVQRLLNRRGAHLHVDGDYGDKTAAAVRAFQRSHDLRQTGAIDHATLRALEGPGVHHKDELVRAGDDNAHVARIERGLAALGYDVGAVDGRYDAQLQGAVKAFQRDEHLRGDGGVMRGSAQRRVRTALRALDHDPQHTRVRPSTSRRRLDALTAQQARVDGGIGPGGNARAIKNVQAHLRAAGYDPKGKGGVFDARTEGALRAFQRRAHLEDTGRVDADTWRALSRATMEASSATSPAQRLGERSNAVLHSERVMKKLGLKVGKVDGVFDDATLRASRAFERKHAGMGHDGAIDAKQLHAMERAARRREPNLHTVRGCAQFLLHSRNVRFWSGLSTGSDRKNLERLARGDKAFVPATGGHVTPSLRLMQALVDMAKHGPIMINALTGGTHSPNSNHYRGVAVDLDVSVGNTAEIERIARKHGGLRNFERDHIHLDF